MQFTDDFFKAEIKNEFKVEPMLKRMWAATMEVLEAIIEVCDKHDIKYFADWGTILGAVRHKGFIPWDDDIDICLMRNDYMRLIDALKTDLPHGLVLSGMYSDSKRLQETTYVPHIRVIADNDAWDFNDYMVRFHGFPFQQVGIDIFPIDKLSNDAEKDKQQQQLIQLGITILMNWDYMIENNMLEKQLKIFEKEAGISITKDDKIKNTIWREIDKICMWYNNEDNNDVAEFLWYIDNNKHKYKQQWFSEAIPMKFENMEIMVPKEYDKILSTYYGDYNQFVKFAAGHDFPMYKHMQKELVKNIRATGFRGSVEMFCDLMSKGKLKV